MAQWGSRSKWDGLFVTGLFVIGGLYVFLILAMLAADAVFTTPDHLWWALDSPEIRYAAWLSLVSCAVTAILSVCVAVPLGYVLSRYKFRGKGFIDAVVDIPVVLPPLVIGLSLLILFQTAPGRALEDFTQQFLGTRIAYAVPGVILAQFAVACAFAVRTMRITFDQMTPRQEQVALTLGCSRAQAFWLVVVPEARRGIITAGTIAWARALGEFGPIMVFAGATRMRTEVLSTTVWLELSIGRLESAVAVSLLMVIAAVVVLFLVREFGIEAGKQP